MLQALVPIGGAVVGWGLYNWWKKDHQSVSANRHHEKAASEYGIETHSVTPNVLMTGGQPAMFGTPVLVGKTPAGNPIRLPPIPAPAPDVVPRAVQTVPITGSAVPAAHALYDAIKAQGLASVAPGIIAAFQSAAANDPNNVALTGPIPVTGLYDLPTSSALTIYTGDPIPAPPPKGGGASLPLSMNADLSTPGAAAMSAANLQAYLRLNGKDTSLVLKNLVKQFQHDVNTDVKFPGPAGQKPAVAIQIIKKKLAEDGKYGPATETALAVYGGV
jgi:hypothetical protein